MIRFYYNHFKLTIYLLTIRFLQTVSSRNAPKAGEILLNPLISPILAKYSFIIMANGKLLPFFHLPQQITWRTYVLARDLLLLLKRGKNRYPYIASTCVDISS